VHTRSEPYRDKAGDQIIVQRQGWRPDYRTETRLETRLSILANSVLPFPLTRIHIINNKLRDPYV
jgi:hypothetical protein